jgi:hypothetical protein
MDSGGSCSTKGRRRIGRARSTGRSPALIFLIPFVACTPGGNHTDVDELQDFASRYAEAWSSQDAASVASFYGEGGSLKVNDADPAIGREAITAVAQGFMTAFPDMVVELDSLEIGAEKVEFHWTVIGTNTGPGGTGNAVRFSGREEWILGDDGLIAASLGHFDEAEYNRQLEFGIDGS